MLAAALEMISSHRTTCPKVPSPSISSTLNDLTRFGSPGLPGLTFSRWTCESSVLCQSRSPTDMIRLPLALSCGLASDGTHGDVSTRRGCMTPVHE